MNTDSKVKIISEDFQKMIESLEKKRNEVDEMFKDIDKNLKIFDGSSNVWKSVVQEQVYNNYKVMSQEYPKIIEQLDLYIKFLQTTLDNYEKEEKYVGSVVDNEKSNLEVN